MKSTLIASLLAASIATIAAPAFASGFGPAPSYNPSAGAPASQSGPGVLSLHAHVATDAHAYGGSPDNHVSSGARAAAENPSSVFAHH